MQLEMLDVFCPAALAVAVTNWPGATLKVAAPLALVIARVSLMKFVACCVPDEPQESFEKNWIVNDVFAVAPANVPLVPLSTGLLSAAFASLRIACLALPKMELRRTELPVP